MSRSGIWAVVPVKETAHAKQRLAGTLSPERRRGLALAMLEDVLAALVAAPGLAGIAVATLDPAAHELALRAGARVLTGDADQGHTAAVTAAARLFESEGAAGFLTVPGDVPLISPREVAALFDAHEAAPAFTIVPSRDERGSNAVLCSPPSVVDLRFGDDSFLPHLAAAERLGITPKVLRLAGVGLDIDTPRDLAAFLRIEAPTRTRALLERCGLVRMGRLTAAHAQTEGILTP